MSKKTVLLQLTKSLPLSIKMQEAISVDETSREYRPGIGNALDLPDTTNWADKPEEAVLVEQKPKEEKPKPEAQKKEEAPQGTGRLPENVVKAINKIRDRIGKDKFMKVLGNIGYEKLEDIPDLKEANRLLKELGNGQ